VDTRPAYLVQWLDTRDGIRVGTIHNKLDWTNLRSD